MFETDAHTPPSLLRNWHAPATVTAATTMTTGTVPRRIRSAGSFKMPQQTEVGQSGPPTNMQILPRPHPGSSSSLRIALVVVELTAIRERTAIKSPICPPIIFCWTKHADILSPNEMAMERATPVQNSINLGMRNDAIKYTAKPGTGGSMKKTIPTAHTTAMTMPRPTCAARRDSMSAATNTLVSLPKPTFITIKKTPIQIALVSTEVHAHTAT
mmetsp:Transcript_12770/g.32383  ORF Transcript_12770/g.32383 Transcript_12770/m.32383 type:complete len:214 (-) Transcript_12770:1484-2125(-)